MMKNKILIKLFCIIMVFIMCGCGIKPVNDVKQQKNDRIEGHWRYKHTEELMEHHSEDIYFYEDGSFSSSTWREKCEGEYRIDGNKIMVEYDFYFNPAGNKEYFYQYSGTKIFELTKENIRLIKIVTDDGIHQYNKNYELVENKTVLRDITNINLYRMYTSDETWNTIRISERTEKGFFMEASCCNSSLNLGEFTGFFEFVTPNSAIYYGKNHEGTEYKITADFKGESLLISVDSKKEAEFVLLGFGMNVYLSGGYMKQ